MRISMMDRIKRPLFSQAGNIHTGQEIVDINSNVESVHVVTRYAFLICYTFNQAPNHSKNIP